MLSAYHFDYPETGEQQVLDARSYLWAAFAGPVYILAKGFVGLALVMLSISCAIVGVSFVALIFLVSLLDSPIANVLSLVLVVLAAFLSNAVATIELVRLGYLRRGWRPYY